MPSPLVAGDCPGPLTCVRSAIPCQALPFAPGGMNRIFCLGGSVCVEALDPSPLLSSLSISAISPSVMDILRFGDAGGVASLTGGRSSTRCHFGVTSILHLTQRRSVVALRSPGDETSSSPSFKSATDEVLAPRLTAAAILFAADSLRLPLATGAAVCCAFSLVNCTRFALRTVPVNVRSACLYVSA